MSAQSNASSSRAGLRTGLVLAFVAIGLGLWLLLEDSVGLPPIKTYWPIFMVIAGVATLVEYFQFNRSPGALGQTVFWLCLAVFSFSITLGYAGWDNLLDLLPGIPTIFGLALLTTWLASKRREGTYLLPGLVFLGLGLVGFMARFEWLRNLLPSVQVIWAVILLAGGGVVLWKILRNRDAAGSVDG